MTLHHVAIEAAPDDRDALVAFFGLLGFQEVGLPDGMQGKTRWLERDGRQIHLLFVEQSTAPPLGHLAVVAGDYDAALARLRAAGFEPEPSTEYWGSPRCFVLAPGGHRVEVMAFPPGGGG